MAIIIKEILVRAIIVAGNGSKIPGEETLLQMKKDIIKEVKETMRRERIQKQER